MSILSGVGGLSSSIAGQPGVNQGAQDAFSTLSSEDFFRIIFTELQTQDPLQPSDTSKLVEQISGIRSIQSDMDLQERLESVVKQNELASAGGMIGRWVTGLTEQNVRVSDSVRSVSVTDEGPVLNLQSGQRVPFSRIESVDAGQQGTRP